MAVTKVPYSNSTSLLCQKDVMKRLHRKSASTIWRQVKLGQFPEPTVKIGGRYPHWSEELVETYLRGEWRGNDQ
jgi:predicted DNA-binding transcriptional regulator AlpA